MGSPTPVRLVGISYFRTEERSNSMSNLGCTASSLNSRLISLGKFVPLEKSISVSEGCVYLNLVSCGVLSPGAIHEAHAARQFKVSHRLHEIANRTPDHPSIGQAFSQVVKDMKAQSSVGDPVGCRCMPLYYMLLDVVGCHYTDAS